MQLVVLTPEKEVYKGEATLVHLQGVDGQFQIMDKHAPLIAALSDGLLKITNNKEKLSFFIKGGIVEVLNNKVSVLTEGVEE